MKHFLLAAVMFTAMCGTAQTTGTQLKTQIDTDITNKTGSGSITKAAVGGNMKAIVDYASNVSLPASTSGNEQISRWAVGDAYLSFSDKSGFNLSSNLSGTEIGFTSYDGQGFELASVQSGVFGSFAVLNGNLGLYQNWPSNTGTSVDFNQNVTGQTGVLHFPTSVTGTPKTLVTSVNGNYADADGNVTVDTGGGTSDLQDVSNNGSVVNLDNQEISFNSLSTFSGGNNKSYMGVSGTGSGGFGIGTESQDTGKGSYISGTDQEVGLYTTNGVDKQASIRVLSFDNTNAITLQDDFGHIGLQAAQDYSDQIVVTDNAYTTTKAVKALISSDAPYKSYVITLTQSGTSDPTIVETINEIGGTPTVTRIGAGSYSITITGAFVTASKCVGFPTQQMLAGSTSVNMNDISLFRQSDNTFRLLTRTNAVGADNLLTDFPIEIRVYN